jgi:hypothetical protein
VKATWSFQTSDNLRLSDQWGGPHGVGFNDVAMLPASPVVRTLLVSAGSRVDRLEVALSDGTILSHGGSGGTAQSLLLDEGEYLESVELCSGEVRGHTRIFYARFTTSAGRALSGGSITSSCTTYAAPSDWQIVGFHGRSGDEVDKLGVIFAPRGSVVPGPAEYCQMVNEASGLCLDVWEAKAAPGTNVAQWSCHAGDGQKWSYDPASGLIRSKLDPRYCLDNGGVFANGANLRIWRCNGSANQRFTIEDNMIGMRTWPTQVVDAFGTSGGDNVGTWSHWGGANQHWRCVP